MKAQKEHFKESIGWEIIFSACPTAQLKGWNLVGFEVRFGVK